MATAIKTKSSKATSKQSTNKEYQEPKRLSKFALWRKENPNGIYTVIDWRAVNK